MTFDTMTKPIAPARNWAATRWAEYAVLLLILLVAAALRLHNVAFGLPALNDADEPLFMMTALEMLQKHSFNPGWFGHPGTITLYCLALISLGVGVVGIATGRFADTDAFVAAVYADPGVVFLPGRLFIVACGVACVWLTYLLGKRLGGPRLGLIAAAFLAVNSVHVQYSQIIRTDIQATVFMLLCALSTVAMVQRGRTRDYVLAGMFAGLACATKWPTAIIILNPLIIAFWRQDGVRHSWRKPILIFAVALLTLIVVSPYLLLDYPTVISNLTGEARTTHPGATGSGFLSNLGWYASHPLLTSFSAAGLALSVLGLVAAVRERSLTVTILPATLGFFVLIGAQALLWERWIVPMLPFVAIASAQGLCCVVDLLRQHLKRRAPIFMAAAALLAILPMIHATQVAGATRTQDTRQIASDWVHSHVPNGSSIVVEHAAFDILGGPWKIVFPLGSAGCVDAREVLGKRIRYSRVDKLRSGRAVVDLAHVDLARLSGCRADYAVLSHYDGYRDDPVHFRDELARYALLLRGGRMMATFRPEQGARTGPVVRIVRLAQ